MTQQRETSSGREEDTKESKRCTKMKRSSSFSNGDKLDGRNSWVLEARACFGQTLFLNKQTDWTRVNKSCVSLMAQMDSGRLQIVSHAGGQELPAMARIQGITEIGDFNLRKTW